MSHFRKNVWMYGVIGVFVAFAVLMTYFAIIASRNKESLVIKDYYKAELEYQKQIDKIANAAALPTLPQVNIKGNSVEIFFAALINSVESGTITCYRADDPSKDIVLPLEPSSTGTQAIPISLFVRGAWKVKLDWESKGRGYYYEKDIQIIK